MSNISTFLGSGGGGGGAVSVGTNTYNGAVSLDRWKRNNFMVYSTRQSTDINHPVGVRNTNDDTVYQVANTTSYQDIVNITSATNGGALCWLTFYYHQATLRTNMEPNFRVTIDGGTAVELQMTTAASFNKYAGHFGPVLKESLPYTNYASLSSNYGTYFRTSGQQWSQSIDSSKTDNILYYLNTGSQNRYTALSPHVPQVHVDFGLPWVHFTSSIRVEAKCDGNAYGNSYAGIVQF